jgi:hypothetical protein
METHEGVVAFEPMIMGRQGIMLGRVRVGEIAPSEIRDPNSRCAFCFRLDLPDMSSRAWQPARDVADAQRQALVKINDWLNAAGVTPIGALMTMEDARAARTNGAA